MHRALSTLLILWAGLALAHPQDCANLSPAQLIAPTGVVAHTLQALQQQLHLPASILGGPVDTPCLRQKSVVIPADWLTLNAWAGGPAHAVAPPLITWALTLHRAIRTPLPNDPPTPRATAARAVGCYIARTGGARQERLTSALAILDPQNTLVIQRAAQVGVDACAH